jgi:hypothetical protein
MKSVIKKIITTISMVALMMVPQTALLATATHAQDVSQDIASKACQGLNLDASADCSNSGDSQGSFNQLMKKIINIFSIVVGAVSVIMIIIGGFRYIISGGDSNGVTGAKNTILYALVGLVVVLFAQIIVKFVLSNATN